MKHFFILTILCVFLSGFLEKKIVVDREPDTPSPLLKMDETNRYLLLRRAGFKSLCESFYNTPNDPRYKDNEPQCLEREQETTKLLIKYGVSNLSPIHLREISLWTWWKNYHQRLYECEKANAKNLTKRLECDQAWRDYKKTFPKSEKLYAQ